jgi:hypothetical protein
MKFYFISYLGRNETDPMKMPRDYGHITGFCEYSNMLMDSLMELSPS